MFTSPYINTIPLSAQAVYPGDGAMERRIRSLIRWNAMAMVVRANRRLAGIGGHIATYASCATLLEVGFNHFFRAKQTGDSLASSGDQIFFQGHSVPGIYARAFLEGRLNQGQLENFRAELAPGGGLSSYPHPYLMPDFWEFPTVSMGLSPLLAIYQARFNRYLEARGLKKTERSRVWAFLGDGEMDEPESTGALTVAARERLDNLIFVVNCNLQRLDGPVRGNGKIIQELESVFLGAGWNVIKVIWGADWDPLLAQDVGGALVKRMGDVVDGDYQKYVVESGATTRKDFFGVNPELQKMAAGLSDDQIRKLNRGGHDPQKVFAAYQAACKFRGAPTVILAKTVKGYGLGDAGEGKNVSHQQKKMDEQQIKSFRDRFDIPVSDNKLAEVPFFRPPDLSPEIQYLLERRAALGGFVPKRIVTVPKPAPMAPALTDFKEFLEGSGARQASTTMAFSAIISNLLRHPKLGKMIVPIIPDEARTFGMEGLFRQVGIYSSVGQLYTPVDAKTLLYYKEAKDGQLLEEGITEAGAMSSFAAAATAYATHGVPTVPFYIFYSMFGLQRTGDLAWALGDMRARGFLLGATAGRTTLQGEGLQHQDGHSLLLASTYPHMKSYDPAFAYELAVILREGMREMLDCQRDVVYYITLYNENYPMPPMPRDVDEGIIRGMYRIKAAPTQSQIQLLGSGPVLLEVLQAAKILDERHKIPADVWSVTSFNQLRREALETDRWNRLHPSEPSRVPWITQKLSDRSQPVLAATDFMKAIPDQIAGWVPGGLTSLGTDGFGRSDSRAALRKFFEVDAEAIVNAALYTLSHRKM